MTNAEPLFNVAMIWPGAFLKGTRTTAAGNPIEDYFISDGERYAMDFAKCGNKAAWYQYDTPQDAWYYGVWVNPADRIIVTYAEGDIGVIRCDSAAAYAAELAALDAFTAQYLDMTVEDWRAAGRYGIDDHDRQYQTKLVG